MPYGLTGSSVKLLASPRIAKFLKIQSLNLSRNMSTQRRVAVILSGCGVYDGTEVHEASSCLIHLSRAGSEVKMFAPDIDQMHVINHLNGQELPEKRNVLIESGRIARGAVSALSELSSANDYDALIIPGGFGAAKNLSNFAVNGAECTVNAEVSRVIKAFHAANKPIGMCCIAPTLAARLIPNCQVTMGAEPSKEKSDQWPYADATTAVAAMGAKHVQCSVQECCVDEANALVTTPAYMCNTSFHLIYEGVGQMVSKVLSLIK